MFTVLIACPQQDALTMWQSIRQHLGDLDRLIIVDWGQDALFVYRPGDIVRRIEDRVHGRSYQHIRGDYAFILTGNEKRDQFLHQWFARIDPEAGFRGRLFEMRPGEPEYVLRAEKPAPLTKVRLPGHRTSILGS